MKKTRIFTCVILAAAMLFAACSSPAPAAPAPVAPAASQGGAAAQSQAPAAAPAAAPVLIQIGYENNPGEPTDLAATEWKRLLEEKSNGAFKVELFPSSQLGSKNDIIDQMVAGDSVITLADGGFFADRGVADFGITVAPYLFDSWEQCWKLIESDWWKEQAAKMEDKGIKLISSNWMYGERHTLTIKPVRTVADFKGMKIRTPNNALQIKGFEVMGATPTPMALGEVYTSLQQGTIDGVENPLPVLYGGKFDEVAKYLTLDGHIRMFTTWLCGISFYDSLTPELQQILIDTANEAGIHNNSLQEALASEMLDKFRADGVEVIEVDKSEFKAASEAFYSMPEFTSIWSPGLYETIKGIIK